MTRTDVSSTSIASVGYDPDTETLEVEFTNGGVYQYDDVSAEQHAALLAAPSIGKYFAAVIRRGFPSRKVA